MVKRKPLNLANAVETLYAAYRPFIWKMICVIVLGVIGRFLLLSNSQLIAHTVDTKDINKIVLEKMGLQILAVLSVSLLCALIFRILFSRYSALAVSKIHDEAIIRVSRFPQSFFDTQPIGKIATRFSSDYGNIFRLFGGPLAEFLSIIFDLIAITILLILIHPIFIFVVFLIALSFSIILMVNQNQLRFLRKEVSKLRAPSIAHFSETLQGALNIRQFLKIENFNNKFKQQNELFLDSKYSVFKQVFSFSTQLSFVSFIVFIFNGSICIYLHKNQTFGIGQTTLVLGMTILATQTLQMFFEWYSQFDEALVGVERMDEYLRSELEMGSELPLNSDFLRPFKLSLPKDDLNLNLSAKDWAHALEVKNLNLVYAENAKLVLENISFSIRPGEKLGIIGTTGAGKSSLMSAILKLYPISKGEIKVDGREVSDISQYRQKFSVISQETFFFKGTLRDNIDPEKLLTNEQISTVMDQINYSESLSKWIEENGKNLSVGEKQVISLIRGLVKKSDIFIFDEATAHIDPVFEKVIQQAIETVLAGKSQIRIAHRLDTVIHCDRLIWLDQGKIKKEGSPQEVLAAFQTNL